MENQLADGHPSQVKATLMRLVMKGTPREEALQYIACALGAELMAMEAEQGPSTSSVTASFSTAARDALGRMTRGSGEAPAPAIIITATTNDGVWGYALARSP